MIGRKQQQLTQLGSYRVCDHAMRRIKDRQIRTNEILYTLDSHDSMEYLTRDNRTIVYNKSTDISIIVDNETGIVITVTETDDRKIRTSKRKRLFATLGNQCVHYPSIQV